MSLELIRINGLLEQTRCARMWGDDGPACCPTHHYCMQPIPSSTTKIDGENVCGEPFCMSCTEMHKLEGSRYCPTHHPSIKDTTTIKPLVSVVDKDGNTLKVPINGKEVEETDEITCRMMKMRSCVIKKEAGGFRKGVTGSTGLFYCTFSGEGHDKPIHFECYDALINNSYKQEHLCCQVDGEKVAMYVCGKKCYNVYNKVLKGRIKDAAKKKLKAASTHWKTDGSEEWIVAWLANEPNCNQWMGSKDTSMNTMSDPDGGLTKDGICKKISQQMNTAIGISRSGDSIKSKLYDLIGRFKSAADNARNTGEGIRSTEGEESFKEFMLSRFRYYYDLVDVLGSRHSINAAYTNDELLASDSDTSRDSCNDDEDDSSIKSTSDVTTSTTHDTSTSTSTPRIEAGRKTSRDDEAAVTTSTTTTKQLKKRKGGKATKDLMKEFNTNTNSAKRKSSTIIIDSGTETTNMNEMITARKNLYRAKLVTETVSSNLNSIIARVEAKKQDSSLTDEMLNQLFPLVYPPGKGSTSNTSS